MDKPDFRTIDRPEKSEATRGKLILPGRPVMSLDRVGWQAGAKLFALSYRVLHPPQTMQPSGPPHDDFHHGLPSVRIQIAAVLLPGATSPLERMARTPS